MKSVFTVKKGGAESTPKKALKSLKKTGESLVEMTKSQTKELLASLGFGGKKRESQKGGRCIRSRLAKKSVKKSGGRKSVKKSGGRKSVKKSKKSTNVN